jgi:hypothetical protein
LYGKLSLYGLLQRTKKCGEGMVQKFQSIMISEGFIGRILTETIMMDKPPSIIFYDGK